MIISREKGFIFFHIPKNAGTSMAAALSDYGDMTVSAPKHAKPNEVAKHLSRKRFDNLYKFVIVRNPFDAAVSQYFYLLKDINNLAHEVVRTLESFEDFIFRYYITWDDKQYHWTHDLLGNQTVDRVLKLEQLDDEIPALEKELGIQIRMKKLNTSDHDHYEQYHTAETKRAILRHRSLEFCLYGYSWA